jgi:hypothetical protein
VPQSLDAITNAVDVLTNMFGLIEPCQSIDTTTSVNNNYVSVAMQNRVDWGF